jgi:hypothetical protein
MDLDPGAKIARQFCGNGPLIEFWLFSHEKNTSFFKLLKMLEYNAKSKTTCIPILFF